MAKCISCGKKSLFLKVDANGLCEDCRKAAATAMEEAAKEQYARLRKMDNSLSNSNTYSEYASKASEIINYLNEIDIIRVWGMALEDSEKHYAYRYNKLLGCIFNEDKPFERYVKDLCKKRDRAIIRQKGVDMFRATLESIESVEVVPKDNASLSRNPVEDIPEIKYSPIGSSFNKDKLTSFVVIDTETTGLSAARDRIIELSAIKFVEFEPVLSFSTMINPQMHISEKATEVNGITDSDISNAPLIEQVAEQFLDFIGSLPIVGYNLPFDLKFIYASGIDFTVKGRKYYDALDLCRKIYKKELDSFKLSDVADYLGIYRDSEHEALSDCLATGLVLEKAVEQKTGI